MDLLTDAFEAVDVEDAAAAEVAAGAKEDIFHTMPELVRLDEGEAAVFLLLEVLEIVTGLGAACPASEDDELPSNVSNVCLCPAICW